MQPLDGSESLVIDCSVTMAWYFKDEATPYTNAVRAALAIERAAVPALWPLEVANVLLMGERRTNPSLHRPGVAARLPPPARRPPGQAGAGHAGRSPRPSHARRA